MSDEEFVEAHRGWSTLAVDIRGRLTPDGVKGDVDWAALKSLSAVLHKKLIAHAPENDTTPLVHLIILDPGSLPPPERLYEWLARAEAVMQKHYHDMAGPADWNLEVLPHSDLDEDYLCSGLPEEMPYSVEELEGAGYEQLSVEKLASLFGAGTCPLAELLPRLRRAGAMAGWDYVTIWSKKSKKAKGVKPKRQLWVRPNSMTPEQRRTCGFLD